MERKNKKESMIPQWKLHKRRYTKKIKMIRILLDVYICLAFLSATLVSIVVDRSTVTRLADPLSGLA